MSDADWDADDFEPVVPAKDKPRAATDKWAGEDEDDEIKDNWDDDDEEEKPSGQETQTQKAVAKKKKKSLKEVLAEKEAKRVEEAKKRVEDAQRLQAENSSENAAAVRERVRRAQEESDLELAKDAFGVGEMKSDSIDAANPVSKEDFDKFGEALKQKISQYEKSAHYVAFLETLFRDVSLGLEAEDLKKLGATITALSNEKIKQQKAGKGKKKKKGVNLTVSRGDGLDDYEAAAFDGLDDFI